ncbi:MAG: HlyD family secretion protein [Epsilonproteobacteria bacterium]|nr:HlyD family secretion protein [Campylobacterota bacterium]
MMSDPIFHSLEKLQVNPLVKKIWLFSSIVLSLLIMALFLPWQQTVEGEGVVVAYDPTQRDYPVLATMNGFINEFYVTENQFVKKGTKLFTMVDLDKEYLNKLKTIESSSKDQYKNSKIQINNYQDTKKNLNQYLAVGLNVYQQKYEQTKNKIDSLKLKKISLEKKHEIEKSNYERTKLLHADGIESKRNLEVRENSYIEANVELKKISIDLDIEQNDLDILVNEREKFLKETENKIKLLDNDTLSSKNTLQSLGQSVQTNSVNVSRYTSGEVIAEKDGYVVRIFQNDKNKLIKMSERILHFAPKVTTKSLLLKVSDFNMPLIKEGLPVRIMFYGWPALQISGWPEIRFGTFAGIIKRVEQTSREKGFYYAQIVEDPKEPWPKGDSLRIGTQATVWARLETVPIWYQIWRLMNALPPKMVTPVIEKN